MSDTDKRVRDARAVREADALRANLQRRKQQTRARADPGPNPELNPDPGPNPGPGTGQDMPAKLPERSP